MTLVVARQVNNEVYVIGDTKFSVPDGSSWSKARKHIGGLKVILLTPGVCVGFSGNVEIARDAIQGVYDTSVDLFDKNHTIRYFLKHHRHSVEIGDPTDFVVAVIVENNAQPGTFTKEIFRIADSEVHWENVAAYIGDNFSSFQNAFLQGSQHTAVPTFRISKLGTKERPGFDQSLAAAMNAMHCVIDDSDIENVDGFSTVVVSEEDQFKYVEYVQIKGHPTPVNNEPGAPVSFGGAAEGSDIWHVGMDSAFGHGILPAYSIAGRFGLIYHPEKYFEPKIYPNCTEEEFCLVVKERISEAHRRALSSQSRF